MVAPVSHPESLLRVEFFKSRGWILLLTFGPSLNT